MRRLSGAAFVNEINHRMCKYLGNVFQFYLVRLMTSTTTILNWPWMHMRHSTVVTKRRWRATFWCIVMTTWAVTRKR
eukprot:9048892-Pyramimonas_sp.AAC.1